MPRNGSGSYSLPEAAFIPNTAISSAAVNSDFSDIATALTGSLARDGQGGMTAVLPLANTGFVYLNDPNTGIRRTASDTQVIFGGSVDTVEVTTTGASVTGTLAVSGAFTVGGAPLLPIGLGPLPWSGLTAPTKWLLCYGQTLLRADYPDLWTFISAEITGGNTLFTNGNGSTTFTMPDMRGRVPAGKDNMGGSAASRLTGSTMTPDGETLGAVNAASGGQVVTLALAHLPTGITSVNAAQAITVTTAQKVVNGPNPGSAVGGGTQVTASDTGSGGALSLLNSTGSNSISVTSNNTGAGAHSNVQPTIVTNYIIFAGA
jgi:microcystin-dependent protein